SAHTNTPALAGSPTNKPHQQTPQPRAHPASFQQLQHSRCDALGLSANAYALGQDERVGARALARDSLTFRLRCAAERTRAICRTVSKSLRLGLVITQPALLPMDCRIGPPIMIGIEFIALFIMGSIVLPLVLMALVGRLADLM